LRPGLALEEPPRARLDAKRVLLVLGRDDPSLAQGAAASPYLAAAGAEVEVVRVPRATALWDPDVEALGSRLRAGPWAGRARPRAGPALEGGRGCAVARPGRRDPLRRDKTPWTRPARAHHTEACPPTRNVTATRRRRASARPPAA